MELSDAGMAGLVQGGPVGGWASPDAIFAAGGHSFTVGFAHPRNVHRSADGKLSSARTVARRLKVNRKPEQSSPESMRLPGRICCGVAAAAAASQRL